MRIGVIGPTWPDAFAAHIIEALSALAPLREIHTGRLSIGEEKARVFRSAAAVLNNLHPAEISGVNARLFEAAGSGAAADHSYEKRLAALLEKLPS
jgi:hypothetical protein